MRVNDGDINGLKIIQLDVFRDLRGQYVEYYNEKEYSLPFVTDCISHSVKDVIRGLHGDFRTTKLISCVYGSIQYVALDIRKESPTFGSVQEIALSMGSGLQILVPSGCVQGFLCLSDECLFYYKQNVYYEGMDKQVTIQYNDPSLGIKWKCDNPIVSDRDKNGLSWSLFKEFPQ